MARVETWIKTDLKQLLKVTPFPGDFFDDDAGANRILVELYNGGVPETVVGDVSGKIITADGQTKTVTGNKSTNKAWVFVPASAYSTPGFIGVYVKLTNNGVVTTIGAVEGMVAERVTT